MSIGWKTHDRRKGTRARRLAQLRVKSLKARDLKTIGLANGTIAMQGKDRFDGSPDWLDGGLGHNSAEIEASADGTPLDVEVHHH